MSARRTTLCLLLVALAAAPIPLTHRIRCRCELQPSVRRFAVVPFDGLLLESLVRPGDVVHAGDVLARLDPIELQHEASAAAAEHARALKAADVQQVAGNTAAAVLDRLEALRIEERRKVLEHRLANLEIRSPLTGIVIAGDGDRVRGAPLKCGQTLFEIAPLDRMVVETSVLESDFSYVVAGQEASVVLDALPAQTLQGKIERIRPRCEIRDEQWIFLAEWELPNADDRLRPGMKGRATIAAPPRAAGWILLHRAWEIACELSG